MLDTVAFSVVVLAGTFLTVLGGACFAAPTMAGRFLLGFAGNATVHWVEQALRLVVGAAFVLRASQMLFTTAMAKFDWMLVATTASMLFVPWRLHGDFARRTVPGVVRHLKLLGSAAVTAGVIVLISAVAPVAKQVA